MNADECFVCSGAITRTGVSQPYELISAAEPVGFCGGCQNLQMLRGGTWRPVGPTAPDATDQARHECGACGATIMMTSLTELGPDRVTALPVGLCDACQDVRVFHAGRWVPLSGHDESTR